MTRSVYLVTAISVWYLNPRLCRFTNTNALADIVSKRFRRSVTDLWSNARFALPKPNAQSPNPRCYTIVASTSLTVSQKTMRYAVAPRRWSLLKKTNSSCISTFSFELRPTVIRFLSSKVAFHLDGRLYPSVLALYFILGKRKLPPTGIIR